MRIRKTPLASIPNSLDLRESVTRFRFVCSKIKMTRNDVSDVDDGNLQYVVLDLRGDRIDVIHQEWRLTFLRAPNCP